MLFFWTFYKNAKQNKLCFEFNINKKNYWAANRHIRMISVVMMLKIQLWSQKYIIFYNIQIENVFKLLLYLTI